MSDFQTLVKPDGRVQTALVLPDPITYFRGFATDGAVGNFIVKEWDGNEIIYFNAGIAVNGLGVILINPNPPTPGSATDSGMVVDSNGILFASETGIIDVIHQEIGLDSATIGGVLQVTVGAASAPPDAPTTLTAVASLTLAQIQLDWVDVATTEAGYRLEWNTTAAVGPWDNTIPLAANTDSYLHTGLIPSTQYWYRVFAFNGAGDSAPSNTATATVGDVLDQRVTGAGDVRVTGSADRRIVVLA